MAFVQLLKDLDLFELKQAVYNSRNPDGTEAPPQLVAEYFAVSDEKLQNLPPEKLSELIKNGALGTIFAHMISLLGWDRLMAVAVARGPDAMPRNAAAQAANKN